MERIKSRDVEVVLKFLQDIYAVRSYEVFCQHLVDAVPRLIPSCSTIFLPQSLFLGRRNTAEYIRHDFFMNSMISHSVDYWKSFFDRAFSEHPVVRVFSRTTEKRAMKISDVMTNRQWKKTAYYNDGLRPLGYLDQVGISLAAPTQLAICGTLSLQSDGNYTERDKTLLDILRPHLRQAFLNSLAVSKLERDISSMTEAIELMDRGVVVLKENGQIGLLTPQAHAWVREYFGASKLGHLPEALERWVRSERLKSQGESAVAHVREPLRVEREGKRLAVRWVKERSSEMLLMEEKRSGMTVEEIQPRFGLTRREAEVMYWVAEGKSNMAVATILSMSPKTVEKHLERIFLKLGVENRTGAAMTVANALSL